MSIKMNNKTTVEDNSSKNISANDSLLIKLKNIIDDYAIESDGCEEGFTLDAILKDILQRQKTALQNFKQRLSKYSIKDTAKDTIFTRENIDDFINTLRGTDKTTRVLKQIALENQFNEDLPVLLTADVNSVESLLKNDTLDYDGFDIVLCVKELLQQIDQFKVELEQEKALKETYLTCYKAKHEDIEGALFKLKQTLAEIKEITKNMNKECFYNDFSCDGCDMINGCTYQGKLSALQKIKECEVENAKN